MKIKGAHQAICYHFNLLGSTNMNSNTKLLGVLVFFTLALAKAACADIFYEIASGYSPTQNPNGLWGYGWSATLGGPFMGDSVNETYGSVNLWEGPWSGYPFTGATGYPFIGQSTTSSQEQFGTGLFYTTQVAMHPGPSSQYAILRWVAPGTGYATISASFTGEDFFGGTTTDTHVLVNGTSIFDGSVNGYLGSSSFSGAQYVQAGDTIDFAVGDGGNGNPFDTTGLSGSITLSVVPEPSSLALLSLTSVVGFWGSRLARRKKVR